MWGRELWGVGVSIGHRQYSQHSLKVRHLLKLGVTLTLTQQCSPWGLKCVGPRCRTGPSATPLINSSSLTASLFKTMGHVLPPGPCHNAPLGLVSQYQAGGLVPTPDPTSENEMISPVWSVPSGSLPAASRAVCHYYHWCLGSKHNLHQYSLVAQ